MKQDIAFYTKTQMKEGIFHHSKDKLYKADILEGVSTFFINEPLNSIVNGIGVTFNKRKGYSIKVYSRAPFRFKEEFLREEYGISRGDIYVANIGDIKAQQASPTDRIRPVCPGVSVGHYDISAGTLGCFVSNKIGQYFIFSNNHVLANNNGGSPGDGILQPGAYDGGMNANNEIAELYQFVPLSLRDVNIMDAAIAILKNDTRFQSALPEIGRLRGSSSPGIGNEVQKFGRTTGYTNGQVVARGVDIQVNYGGNKIEFEDQVEIAASKKRFSNGGDSGSLIVDKQTKEAIGLLFAGSSGGSTFANPIIPVLNRLNVNVV